MCCDPKSRILIILIALWVLIQNITYAALSLAAIFTYRCEIEMKQSKLTYLWFLTYFRGECHDKIDYEVLEVPVFSPQPNWPAVSQVAFRTNIFMYFYCVMSFLLGLSSMIMIISVLCSCSGKHGFQVLLKFWISFAIVILILDCVSIGFYISDINQTKELRLLLEFLEIKNILEIENILKDLNKSPTFVPSVAMLVLHARGLIPLVLNILCIITMVRTVKAFAKNDLKLMSNVLRKPDFGYECEEYQYEPRIVGNQIKNQTKSSEMRYRDPNALNYEYDNSSYIGDYNSRDRVVHPKKKHIFQEERRNIPRQASLRNDEITLYSRQSSNNNRQFNEPNYVQNVSRDSNVEQASVDSGWMSPTQRSIESMDSEDKRSVNLINRPSFSLKPDRNSQQLPPGALRSQLPWSYTSNPENRSAPKRTFVAIHDDEDLPPVPVPDYTLHFPKVKRQTFDQNGS